MQVPSHPERVPHVAIRRMECNMILMGGMQDIDFMQRLRVTRVTHSVMQAVTRTAQEAVSQYMQRQACRQHDKQQSTAQIKGHRQLAMVVVGRHKVPSHDTLRALACGSQVFLHVLEQLAHLLEQALAAGLDCFSTSATLVLV